MAHWDMDPALANYYERQYRGKSNPIPNYDQYFTDWRDRSDTARRTLRCHPDLAYGSTDAETLDLFPAPNSTNLLIFLHGGYWYSMDKRDYSWIASAFVEAGISVAVLNYALCPTVTMPLLVDQCRRAVSWLHHHAPDYGIAANRLVITGHSAGGHLTGMMFATDWRTYDMPPEAIAGGIALSGLFNLEPFLLLGLNNELGLDLPTAREMSPALLPMQVNAPFLAVVGGLESDEFHRQTRAICTSWTCLPPLVLDNCHHFNILDAFTDLNSKIWAQENAGVLIR